MYLYVFISLIAADPVWRQPPLNSFCIEIPTDPTWHYVHCTYSSSSLA